MSPPRQDLPPPNGNDRTMYCRPCGSQRVLACFPRSMFQKVAELGNLPERNARNDPCTPSVLDRLAVLFLRGCGEFHATIRILSWPQQILAYFFARAVFP